MTVKGPALVILLLNFIGLAAVGTAACQVRNSTPQPPSTITRPDSIQDSGFYNYWADMTAQGRAGGVLLGKLTMEGEPLPWEPLLVEVNCKGSVVNRTQTDLQGRFVIRFEDTHGVEKTPQDAQRQLETKYEGCLVKAALAGFHSTEKTIKVENFRDEPDLGTITLSAEDRGSGSEVSATTAKAPSNAMKAFEKARGEWLEQKPEPAAKDLKKAVQIYPEFAEAWFQLGKLEASSDPQAARDAFAKSLAADPKYVLPHEQLAALAIKDGKWQEVVDHTSQAVQLDPAGTPQLWYYDALAKFQLGKTDDAEASAQKALAIDPRHSVPNVEQLLAVVEARKGNYAGALQHLKSCLSYMPAGPNADLLKQQIAQLEQKSATAAK